eukprot:1356260-Ditylum_brightwellii.AAC.1
MLESDPFEVILINQHEIGQDVLVTFSCVDLQDLFLVNLSVHGNFEVTVEDLELLGGLEEAT